MDIVGHRGSSATSALSPSSCGLLCLAFPLQAGTRPRAHKNHSALQDSITCLVLWLWPGHVIRRAGRHGHDGQPAAWAYCGASPYSFNCVHLQRRPHRTRPSTCQSPSALPSPRPTARLTTSLCTPSFCSPATSYLPHPPSTPPFCNILPRPSKQALRYNSSPALCLRECTVTWHRLICLAHHVTLPHSAPSLMQHAVAFPSLKFASLTCTSHLRRHLYEVWTGCMVIYGPIKGLGMKALDEEATCP